MRNEALGAFCVKSGRVEGGRLAVQRGSKLDQTREKVRASPRTSRGSADLFRRETLNSQGTNKHPDIGNLGLQMGGWHQQHRLRAVPSLKMS